MRPAFLTFPSHVGQDDAGSSEKLLDELEAVTTIVAFILVKWHRVARTNFPS